MLGLVMIMVVLINSMFNLSSANGSFPWLMFEALLIVKYETAYLLSCSWSRHFGGKPGVPGLAMVEALGIATGGIMAPTATNISMAAAHSWSLG